MSIRALILAGCGLAAALGPAEPGRAESAPAAAAAPAEPDLETSRAAVAEIDAERLVADRDYAAAMLGHIDRLGAHFADDRELVAALDMLRLIALVTLDRRDEVRGTAQRVLDRRPREADAYGAPISAALALLDYPLLVTAVETASRNVPGVGWAELRGLLDRDFILPVFQELAAADRDDLRVRLASSLFRIGWPGDGDIELSDSLRLILLEARLNEGDRAAAADLAAGLTSPANVLPLLVMRKYDRLFDGDGARLEMLRSALSRYDRQTEENMAGGSVAIPFVIERSRFLRSLGRDDEALSLLLPLTRDVAATVAAHDYGMWIVNQAVYILLALGRADEAVALMERLVALPVAENGGLIGPYINHGIVLGGAGRHEEALAYARRIERDHAQLANDYGRAVLAARIACELAALGRAAETAPILDRLRGGGDRTLGALLDAYVCLGQMDAAEEIAIRRLEGDDAVALVMAFQDFEIEPETPYAPDPTYDRYLSLRERPAVRAALDRVGRLMSLPVASAAWNGL